MLANEGYPRRCSLVQLDERGRVLPFPFAEGFAEADQRGSTAASALVSDLSDGANFTRDQRAGIAAEGTVLLLYNLAGGVVCATARGAEVPSALFSVMPGLISAPITFAD